MLSNKAMDAGLFVEKLAGQQADFEVVLDVSVVVPVYNEVQSLPHLIEAIASSIQSSGLSYQIICVDDGSKDGSAELLQQLASSRDDLCAVILRRNYGQTAAMSAGFDRARGNAISRLIPSKIANWLIGRVTGVTLHDYGCSLKAYKPELVADLNLYGELHRFLPALAFIEGARIAELPVRHHARRFGQSKYGIWRTFRVLMDLLTISFMKKFLTRPMHVFGLLGLSSMTLGTVLGIYLSFLKLAFGQSIGNRPLLILAVVLLLTGVQLFCFGLLAEVMMRTYHESQGKPIYRVREVFGSK